MSRAKDMRGQLDEALEILAVKLDLQEYTKVTSIMTMMFVGHTFEMSDDGFELINLITKTRKNIKKQVVKKIIKKGRQGNVFKLHIKKPKTSVLSCLWLLLSTSAVVFLHTSLFSCDTTVDFIL